MDIKTRIQKLGHYFKGMNVVAEEDVIYVAVQFPKGWACSELTELNYNVKTVRHESYHGFYFFASMEVGFDKIFDAIEYNILFNEEAQAKVNLLREKMEELTVLFETNDIETLKTLTFELKKTKSKSKTKLKKIKQDEPVAEQMNQPELETQVTSENNDMIEVY